MGLAMVTIGIIVIGISERNMLDMRLQSGKTLMNSFRSLVEDGYLSVGRLDAGRLAPLARGFAAESGASLLYIVDDQYQLVAERGADGKVEPRRDERLIQVMKEGEEQAEVRRVNVGLFFSRYEDMVIYVPVVSAGGVRGVIKADFPLADVNDLLSRTRWLLLFFLAFDLLLLLFFGSYLLSKRIISPLNRFVRAAERIAEGDLSQRVDYGSENELGQLAGSFNKMADRLEDHIGYLQRVNRELLQTRQQLIRSEKLASVGRLAAGVAHEVGNPLGAILGYAEMLIKGGNDEALSRDFAGRIEKEVKKIDLTIRELLDYSRPSRVEIRAVDVNLVIRETLSFLSHQKDFGRLRVDVNLEEPLPPIKADDQQLQQVLINIILNAVDALAAGGDLRIESGRSDRQDDGTVEVPFRRRKTDSDAPEFRVRKRGRENDMVAISVSDSGSGIRKEDLGRIFDPFFTTKDPGKGTGLGLSISQRIIEAFDGTIEVSSEEGAGARFTILLPVWRGEAAQDVSEE